MIVYFLETKILMLKINKMKIVIIKKYINILNNDRQHYIEKSFQRLIEKEVMQND
mgnify:CR=1 FL=1